MTKPTFFTTPSGDTMAVLPAEEYERLVRLADRAADDEADVAAFDRAHARVARGEDERVPSDVVARLLVGENAVRVWREYRGLALADLAAAAGISVPYLSQIETGARQATAAKKKIAAVLKVDRDDLD